MSGICGCGGKTSKNGDQKQQKDKEKKGIKPTEQAKKKTDGKKDGKPPIPTEAKSAEGRQRGPITAAQKRPQGKKQVPVPEKEVQPGFPMAPGTLEPLDASVTKSNVSMKTANYEATLGHGGTSSCSTKASVDPADAIQCPLSNPDVLPATTAAADSPTAAVPPATDAAVAPAQTGPPPSNNAADANSAASVLTAKAAAKPCSPTTVPRPTSPTTTAAALGFALRGTYASSGQQCVPASLTSITSCSSKSTVRIGKCYSDESSISLCSCPMYDVDIRRSHSTIREEEEHPPTRPPKAADENVGVTVLASETIAQRKYIYNMDVELPEGVHARSCAIPADGSQAAVDRAYSENPMRHSVERYDRLTQPPAYTLAPYQASASHAQSTFGPTQGRSASESTLTEAYIGQPQQDLPSVTRPQDKGLLKASRGGFPSKESWKQNVILGSKCMSDHLKAGRHRISDTSSETKESQGLMEVGFECYRCKRRKVYWVCKRCYKRNTIRYCNACKSLSRKLQESLESTGSPAPTAKNTQPQVALGSSRNAGSGFDQQRVAAAKHTKQQPMYPYPMYPRAVLPQPVQEQWSQNRAVTSYQQLEPTGPLQMTSDVQPAPVLITVTCRSNAEICPASPNMTYPGQGYPLFGYQCPPITVCRLPPIDILGSDKQPTLGQQAQPCPPHMRQPSPARKAHSDCAKKAPPASRKDTASYETLRGLGTGNSETSCEVQPAAPRDLVLDIELKTSPFKTRRARSETGTLRSVPVATKSSDEVIVQVTETRAASPKPVSAIPSGKSHVAPGTKPSARSLVRGSSLCGCGHDIRDCRAKGGYTI